MHYYSIIEMSLYYFLKYQVIILVEYLVLEDPQILAEVLHQSWNYAENIMQS